MKKTFKRVLSIMLVAVMMVLSAPVNVSKATNSDKIEFNGHYYQVFNEKLTWSQAKSRCEEMGGHLVTVTTEGEQNFLNTITSSGNSYWLGGEYKNSGIKWITNEYAGYTKGIEWGILNEPIGYGFLAFSKRTLSLIGSTVNLDGMWTTHEDNGKFSLNITSLSNPEGFICEWESLESIRIMPEGYSYNKDSFGFKNYAVDRLSKEYFTTIYNPQQGKILYNNKKKTGSGGLCFGIAYTTALIYNNLLGYSDIYNIYGGAGEAQGNPNPVYVENMRDINIGSLFDIGNGNMSIDSLIKYSFVYQYSSNFIEQENSTVNDLDGLYNTVKASAENDHIGVIVTMRLRKYNSSTGEYEYSGGHAVVAVGIDGNDILIDDSNRKPGGISDNLQRIKINDDGTWKYSAGWVSGGISNENAGLFYSTDFHKPYSILLTGNKVEAATQHTESVNATNSFNQGEQYILGMDKLCKDELLLLTNSDTYSINTENIFKINDESTADESSFDVETEKDMYWIREDKAVTISNIKGENNEFSLSGAHTTIGVKTDAASAISLTMDEGNEISAELDTTKGNEYTVFVESMDEEENDIITTITGTASGSTVTVTETETGIAVEGFNNLTITYTDFDGSDETQIKNAGGEKINITVDEKNNDVTTDYVCEHTDENSDCICDKCEENLPHTETTLPAVSATCTSTGLTEGTKCSVCNEILTTQQEIPMIPHTYGEWIEITAPNCTEKGKEKRTCTGCDTFETKETNATGHSYGDDNICDTCGDEKSCSCNCHKSGFMGFIWKIINLFQKLFKTNPVCSCGKAHY